MDMRLSQKKSEYFNTMSSDREHRGTTARSKEATETIGSVSITVWDSARSMTYSNKGESTCVMQITFRRQFSDANLPLRYTVSSASAEPRIRIFAFIRSSATLRLSFGQIAEPVP